jgi:hypothetical protein
MTPRTVLTLVSLLCASSCAGRPARLPETDGNVDLAALHAKAAQTEQVAPTGAALDAYLDLMDQATAHPLAPHALEALVAATDALALRRTTALRSITPHHALAFRTKGASARVLDRMAKAYDRAGAGPFARTVIARAARELALFQGDAPAAATWRDKSGCVRRATVVGPLDWAPVTATSKRTPVEDPSAKLLKTYPGIPPFAPSATPMEVEADDCDLPLATTSALEGLRAVVVDVSVPRPDTIGIVLESPSAAVLVVGGKPAIVRGYDRGGERVEQWATATVGAGHVRLVTRVGSNGEDAHISLRVLAGDGTPLGVSAPKPGDVAPMTPTATGEVIFGADRMQGRDVALVTAAALARGDGRFAEHLVEPLAAAKQPGALELLLYARAIDAAQDLPENRAIERGRAAYEGVLSTWPSSWEALLGHAQLTAQRRGASEGRIEALSELAAVVPLSPLAYGYEAAEAAEGRLLDVAERALVKVRATADRSPLYAAVEGIVHDHVGPDRSRVSCESPGIDQNGFACLEARIAQGDRKGALSEIARLRALRGSPAALRALELSQHVAAGDAAAARRVYESMRPAERTLAPLGLALGDTPPALRARIAADLFSAADAPGSLSPLYTSLSDSPAPALEARARSLVLADLANPSSTSAATLVLEHVERYAIRAGGLLSYTLFDVRRVAGTTDVEQGIQASGALIEGRDVRRVLRRRIHKPDGRVLEPDRGPHAAQQHAELSQLEKGDYVEQILDGWALPGPSGQLVVDTPDLLPERTSVLFASIEVRRPAGLALSMWGHALLGKPVEKVAGDEKVTTYTVENASPRRIEEGVPKMDRDVSMSFGTSSWSHVARAIAEAIAVLADDDPFVASWAKKTAEPASGSERDVIDRIVLGVGKAVKVASGAILSDSAASLPSGAQSTSARTILELGQGSRSWLAYRALALVGIRSDLVVAEREPFSADPKFPAHFGRFDYPLVVAHTKDGDVWLDLDVQGPPLPAGRVSPELRGRWAMTAKGDLVKVKGSLLDQNRDEIDLRLAVDDRGDAQGTFTILLRGRTAQMIADALEKVVGTDRRDMLRGVVLAWVPWANVNDVELSSSEGSWQVSLRADVSIPGFVQTERGTWVLPGFEPLHAAFPRAVGTLGATFASQADRESALAIEAALQYHVRRRIDLKGRSTLAGPLPTVEIKDDSLTASRQGKLEGGVLEEDFSLSIPTGTIDVARYRDFAKKAHQVDDAFQAAVRIAR